MSWIIQCDIQPDRHDPLLALASEMTSDFQAAEADTLNFEWFVNAERTQLHLHERYANSDTAAGHIQTFGSRYAERFLSLATIKSVTVYGYPTPELKDTLAGMSPLILESFSGFTR
ncbi:MAG: hypothetical protein CL862_01155 [Cyanobium sp. NAT70]|nr:hypothetical protein [Cyanobium sp. NAT70]